MRSVAAESGTRSAGQVSLRVSEEDGSSVVHIVGEMDIACAELLDSTFRTLAQRSRGRVIVDLSRVTFMDSAGLRSLARAKDRMDACGRWLITRGAVGQPRRLLDIGRARYGLTL